MCCEQVDNLDLGTLVPDRSPISSDQSYQLISKSLYAWMSCRADKSYG